LTKLSTMRFRMTWATVAAVVGLMGVTTSGCGCDGGSTLQCDKGGVNCQICDGYGCRPADPNNPMTGAGGAGQGGATTTSTSSGGHGGAPSTSSGGQGCDPTQAACACDNGQCPSGKQCISGLCVADGCSYSYQCPAGDVCANGACVPGCGASSPCPSGYTCTNGACEPDTQNPQCSAQKPCPTGEICGPNGICTDSCTANSQCASDEICDGTAHVCVPDPTPKPGCSATKPCPAPQACEADGFCHYPCTSDSQCLHYDVRFIKCDQSICKTAQEYNPQCTLTKPCPAGMSCISNTCY
jgi:hypothetical protein